MAIPAPTPRAIGCTRLCVQEYGGADITGKNLCNEAIQKAIDALPQAGGEIHFPPGQYLLDVADNPLKLRSNLWLHLDDGAEIIVQANDKIRYQAFPIKGLHDVLISGGTITGDRDGHTYTKFKAHPDGTPNSQDTHEWGMGVAIYGSTEVTVRDTTLRNFTGDGVVIADANVDGKPGSEHTRSIELINIVSTNNRRQGLSIVKASDVTVINSEFSHTKGTKPECGVDIEPEGDGISQNLRFFGCHLHSNNANGLLSVRRGDVSCVITGVLVTGCVIEDNRGCGLYVANTDNFDAFMNTIRGNDQSGINVGGNSTNVHISENSFSHNYDRGKETVRARPEATVVGLLPKYEMDILNRVKDPTQVTVGRNYYS